MNKLNKKDIVERILGKQLFEPARFKGVGVAPSNIALCKYWGKRNNDLNLPTTGSLSISLGERGAKTQIQPIDDDSDEIWVNTEKYPLESAFSQNLISCLDLFRKNQKQCYKIETDINIPIGAGLASSACGFAAFIKALDHLYGWELEIAKLSILARLCSGSACRSLWHGFVEWKMGIEDDGMDSHGFPLEYRWPELRVGLLIVNSKQKGVSSRVAMQRSVESSPFYRVWPTLHQKDFLQLKTAIQDKDFLIFGEVAESNAIAMHALMLTSRPPIVYSDSETIILMQKIWEQRALGLPIFFTQDAGPNLKLLFLEKDIEAVSRIFPKMVIIAPFEHQELS